jgi:23S rRNA pseudouridine1911/1915/1917 synthase
MSGSMEKERPGHYIAATPVVRPVPAELAGQRLDQALAQMFPEHSRSRLTAWLREGHIRIDALSAKPRQPVWGGEQVSLASQPDPESGAYLPEPISLDIVFEDATVIVLDKPAGLVVHPGSGNWQGTMLNALLHHQSLLEAIPRAGIVHRLDKDTSGLLVVAKTLEAQTHLVRQLQARSVTRDYLALVYGRIDRDGEIEAPIGRDPRHRTRMAVVARGKPSRTLYRVLRRFEALTLLECSLATGRTHQIRVHLHSLGHPLVGDTVYRETNRRAGAPVRSTADRVARFARQALHAARLAFVHPASGQALRFESPLPQDMRELIAALE